MFESPYTGRDFVQFGKTKSVLNKRAQGLALLFNPPSVLSLEIMLILENERKNPTCQRFLSFPALAGISISFVLFRYYQVNIKSNILKL